MWSHLFSKAFNYLVVYLKFDISKYNIGITAGELSMVHGEYFEVTNWNIYFTQVNIQNVIVSC